MQFNVPDTQCTTPSGQAAVWVGLDGATSSDQTVEQAGVTAKCVNSKVSYYDWYEMYPNKPVMEHPVSPGDTIVAYANYNPAKQRYYLDIDDESDPAESFNSLPQACPTTCENTSAEVVVEDSGNPQGCALLADFNKVNFSNARIVSASGLVGSLQGNSEWNTEKVTMANGGYPMVTVGARSDGSTAFTDTWAGPGNSLVKCPD